MVAARGKCLSRSAFTPTLPCSSDLYRCLKKRLGRSIRRPHSKRDLVPTRKQVTCKLLGTKSGLSDPKRVPKPLFKQNCTHSNRQHQSCWIQQRPTHSRLAECGSRQAIQAGLDHPNRAVSLSIGLPDLNALAGTKIK